MINSIRRRLRQVQNSFPAGGVLLALLIGYFVYRNTRTSGTPGNAVAAVAWQDIDGTEHGGDDFAEHRATVLFFTSAQCPCADVFSAPFVRVARDYSAQGVRFFAVFSNGNEAVADIRNFAASRQFGFPVVKDEKGELAARLRSAVTPSAVVLDSTGAVLYFGAVGTVPEKPDDAADCGQLVSVLTAVLAGENPALAAAARRALGCAIVGTVTTGLPTIEPQDNRRPAGRLENGVLTLRLRTDTGVWSPEKKDGAGFPMYAFREEGGPLQTPGPLIRVPAGTELRVTIKHTVAGPPLEVHGLHAHTETADPVVMIASGEEREFRWKADKPGTFVYWASVGPPRTTFAEGKDALLNGGLVVDPPGTVPDPHERIFVLNEYLERAPDDSQAIDEDTGLPASTRVRAVMTVNGLTWPYTEPLRYELGERVRWRVINASVGTHPMHLHGFHFDVLSRNDGQQDTFYAEGEREKSVTERIPSAGSIRIEWQATEAGRWLYHCHMSAHFSSRLRVRPPGKGPVAEDEHKRHAFEDMSGLVLGIEIQGGAIALKKPEKGPARELTLHVREHPNPRAPAFPLTSYFVQEGFGGQPPEEFSIPGPPLILTRGQRTQIKVVNHLPRPTAVHWHGIELESIYDGVVGWGGHSASVTPSIAPGGSFIAEMTPPRAGTFIYHTHFDDESQLLTGLYGPLIVLEPGQQYDPDKDRVVLVSARGGRGIQLNGGTTRSMQFTTGQTYRIRLINISLNNSTTVLRIMNGARVLTWRALAKDGALLPPARATVQPASQIVTVGETRDFEFTPTEPGELKFELENGQRTVAAIPVFVQ